jgi:hypothetical protein
LRPALVGVAQQPRKPEGDETEEREESADSDEEVHSDSTRS